MDLLPELARRPVLGGLAAALVAVVATGLVRAIALRLDFVSRPAGERFKRDAKPLGGGIAIVAAFTLAVLATSVGGGAWPDVSTLTILGGAIALLVLGLLDDARDLSPHVKLIAEIALAGALVYAYEVSLAEASAGGAPLTPEARAALPGVGLPLQSAALRVPLTVMWLVAVTNAVNLLDNMDGLAAGVAGVSAVFVAILAATTGNAATAVAAGTLTGACVGYLVWNFPPARIYMGDAGSLPLGFVLAALAAKGSAQETSSFIVALAGPALALAVPLFDTIFVAVLRRLHGRSMFQGGRDHTSHRLVVMGLPERRVVLVFYALAAAGGSVAFLLEGSSMLLGVVVVAAAGIVLFFVGVFLSEVRVYPIDADPSASGRTGPPVETKGVVVFRRIVGDNLSTIAQVIVDTAALVLCFLGAYLARFGGEVSFEVYGDVIARSLPLFVGLKLLVFLAAGLYRRGPGLRDEATLTDLFGIFRAATVGSLLAVAVAALAVRLESYSRAVFLLDWIFTVAAIAALRSLVPFLRDSVTRLQKTPEAGRRAVLVAPSALEPLARAALRGQGVDLRAAVEPTEDGTDGEALAAALREASADLVILLDGAGDAEALRRAASAAGATVRALKLTLE